MPHGHPNASLLPQKLDVGRIGGSVLAENLDCPTGTAGCVKGGINVTGGTTPQTGAESDVGQAGGTSAHGLGSGDGGTAHNLPSIGRASLFCVLESAPPPAVHAGPSLRTGT